MKSIKELKEAGFEKQLCRMCYASAKLDFYQKRFEQGYPVYNFVAYRYSKKAAKAYEEYSKIRPNVADAVDGQECEFFMDQSLVGCKIMDKRVIITDDKRIEEVASNFYYNESDLVRHELGVLLIFSIIEHQNFEKWKKKKDKDLLYKIYKRFFFLIKSDRVRNMKKAIKRKLFYLQGKF